MSQVVRLKRSEKVYLAGMRSNRRKLNEEAIELNWLDRCIELIKLGKIVELKRLWVLER